MRITVTRQLRSGIYNVSLKVSEFTDEEKQKFDRFGIPPIRMIWGPPDGRSAGLIHINMISEQFTAGFKTEDEAKAYEIQLVSAIRERMEWLRAQKDDFTSTEEVQI